eukprot:CAMPEP_0177640292 /NCGR_PEP_ID=MMETSP0447-20121125/6467_1 /TAXON_ID=0 /ORGANISM="Stygamoeba regulata, Strain BSH-02190019" /LENGTH=71 /DNA_ID=CAMNT_0019142357 /DNA_START=131 /DNA_END=346 /DNA_ORIENTATION=-
MSVVKKTVLDMAKQGLYHCTLRFEDPLPADQVNQERLSKILMKQNLRCEFRMVPEKEGVVELTITWGPTLL